MPSQSSSDSPSSEWTRMPDAPTSSGATFNFKQAITQMVQRNASDLLLKVGRPATIRVNGELLTLDKAPLKPEELKSLAEQIMTPRQVKEFAEHKEADFAIGVPVDPVRGEDDPGPEPAAGARGDRDQAARAGARHGGHRVGQVDRAGRDDQPHQPGPSGQPGEYLAARSGERHAVVQRGAAARVAPGARRHPDRRDP